MTTNLLSVIEQLVEALENHSGNYKLTKSEAQIQEAALSAGKQALEQQGEDSGDVTISVDDFEKLECCRRLLEIIATGGAEDPRKDAEDELVAHGFWNPSKQKASVLEPVFPPLPHSVLRCGQTVVYDALQMHQYAMRFATHPQSTEPAPSTAVERVEVVEDLLMYAGDNGYSHIDYADTMRHAAALLSAKALPVGELTEMHLLDTPEPDKYVDCGEGRPLPMFHLSTLLQYGARLAAASSQPVRE